MSQLLQNIKKRGILPLIQPKDANKLKESTGNIYKSIVVTSRRANQINERLTNEIHRESETIASVPDTFEETQENLEQIELSRAYEQLPCPTLVALDEFEQGEVIFGNTDTIKAKYKHQDA